jgi:hypothetical protein
MAASEDGRVEKQNPEEVRSDAFARSNLFGVPGIPALTEVPPKRGRQLDPLAKDMRGQQDIAIENPAFIDGCCNE